MSESSKDNTDLVEPNEEKLDEEVASSDEVDTDHDQPSKDESIIKETDTSEELSKLNEKLIKSQDDYLRLQAEMQNLRKRSERDIEKAHKYGLEKLINGLLPVLDNFDRAIDSVSDESLDNEQVKPLLEGIKLTKKTALDVLKSFSVEVIEPYGEPFNPEYHEAMSMVPSDTVEPNSVIDVLQKGYSLNGRLLRAAMVIVAKKEE